MKPAPFRYARPETVEEAASLLAEHGDEAKVLAGGQSLVPMLNMRIARPSLVVDANRLPLDGIAEENGSWRVGALVRQADPRLLEHPLLAEAIPFVGHFATRNRGTVGGSIAHADAAAELPVCLTLLGGAAVTSSGRTIPAQELFVTHFTTSLEPDELLVATLWPRPAAGFGYAFAELAQRRGDYALCMAAAAAGPRGELRVALGAVVDRPTVVDVDPDAPGRSAAAQVEPFGNLHASARYLRHLAGVLVERAVARARERARP
ncbi:MAG TPA: FAD binding domain-containing protein [Gaiellaceae bacterium]|nr:FAD binding domain-containing protein [Gaiellaceae bacterium]